MNYISKTAAASAGRRISAELRNAVHPGLGVKYDPRIRDTAANAAMRVVDAIEALKSIPAPAEGNEAEAAAKRVSDQDVYNALYARVHGAPEPYGCSDCLNTGFDMGLDNPRAKAAEASLDKANARIAELEAIIRKN